MGQNNTLWIERASRATFKPLDKCLHLKIAQTVAGAIGQTGDDSVTAFAARTLDQTCWTLTLSVDAVRPVLPPTQEETRQRSFIQDHGCLLLSYTSFMSEDAANRFSLVRMVTISRAENVLSFTDCF
ncbi:hypothetical protein UPYG_G00213100 [Umbra pygmaea]|uniref:Uncharacterized protein n=1 Tax=Umbra pygmaea TaxID=75934 RepID=A0ABD0WK65_UMBPY